MKKVVLNYSYHGGFELSNDAKNWMEEHGMLANRITELFHPINRDDPLLVRVVEELGMDASVIDKSNLVIEEFDDTNHTYGIDWDHTHEILRILPVLRLQSIIGKTPEEIITHAESIGIRVSR